MFSKGMRIAAGVLAAASAGIAITAAAAPASAAGQTISYTQKPISDHTFNLGSGHGIAVGFVELAADKLMHGGTQIGTDGENCTVTRLGGGTADELCTVVAVLRSGQIDLSGLVTSTQRGPGTFNVAVTGGTGSYAGATGYATVVAAQHPRVTIHLTR
jgi:allene oxide cyclase-like protein